MSQRVTEYLEILRSKLSQEDYEKLSRIPNLDVHRFIAESVELCNPSRIFVCGDTQEEIAYIRRMAIETGEEMPLATPGHTVHFDGPYDQGRDREATKYLVPKGDQLSKALNQIDRDEGLAEVKALLKNSMSGRTMIVRFVCLGPTNSIFSILGLQCTDSWYVAHSESILFRPGYKAFCNSKTGEKILKVLHSAGRLNEKMVSIDHEKKRIYIDYT
ncbi:MAG: phosphoenolpyruvate carboxykinase, partial [Candidatus Bathyarchaeia archaeon]